MAKKIHYEDNLFYIREIIKSLRRGFSVEIDREFFTDKVTEDALFIDAALRRMCAGLIDNNQLINRPEVLRSVMVSISQYLEAIRAIVDKPDSAIFFQAPIIAKFKDILSYQQDELQKIKQVLVGADPRVSSEDLVSQEEFDLLLNESE